MSARARGPKNLWGSLRSLLVAGGESVIVCLAAAIAFGCSSKTKEAELIADPPSGLDWGSGPSFVGIGAGGARYDGDEPIVLSAQEALATGADLHAKVILRSCGPLSGVCHNQKEYPDLHTTYNFLSAIDAPCNVQPGTLESVYDRCERTGDRVAFEGGPEIEIGWLEFIPNPGGEEGPPGPEMPGLHLHLADAVSGEDGRDATVRFIRTFIQDKQVADISYTSIRTRWFFFDGGRHLVGRARYDVETQVNALLQVGIEQGDLNRNGVFGARPNAEGLVTGPVSLLRRGDPETSYLIARMRGHMQGEPIPGTRMPLANPPLTQVEMLALFCFVEGLPSEGPVDLDNKISYGSCNFTESSRLAELEVEGTGTGWVTRVRPLFEANCGGCHSQERREAELVLVGDGSYDAIVGKPALTDREGRPLIDPGNPEGSYLYLKLIGDESILGRQMPLDPLLGVRTLGEEELADIAAWISEGAIP